METTLKIRVTPKPEDYSQSLQTILSRNNFLWALLGCLGVPFPILFLYLLIKSGPSVFSEWGAGSLFTVFIVGGMAYLAYIPNRLKSHAERTSSFTASTTYSFDEDGVEITNGETNVRQKWSAFANVLETKKYYLIVYSANKNAFQFIPKSAFETSEQENIFRQIATRFFSDIPIIDNGLRGWGLTFTVGAVITLLVFIVVVIPIFNQ